MSKSWHTKKKILKFIGDGTKTPGEISESLGLAPSTVSEHMEGLEKVGAIKQVPNPYVKKWKYYRLNPNFKIEERMNVAMNKIPLIPTAFVVLLVLGAFAFAISGTASGGSGNQVFFRLTDPPEVPNGTQALNVTYSSIQAHVAGGGNESGWISGIGSGSLILMRLINTSQVIGTGNIPANASVDKVRFSITSAIIVINGTSYSVTVPSGQLTASVTGSSKVNSNSSILMDISPVVAAIYTENSTVFVMVPSLKAIVVGERDMPFHFGERRALAKEDIEMLNRTTPNVGIISANMSVTGNVTSLFVKVKNNANRTIFLNHVMVRGISSVFITPNSMHAGANRIEGVDIQGIPGPMMLGLSQRMLNGALTPSSMAGMLRLEDDYGRGANEGNMTINGVRVSNGKGKWLDIRNMSVDDSHKMDLLARIGFQAKTLQVLNFIVGKNATLELPFLTAGITQTEDSCTNCYGNDSRAGYALQPGESVVLRFSDEILYANGHMRIAPVIGSKYTIFVSGQAGAEARTNVTVS
jgi:DNA-binding transcriptional ArsR family regulator